MEMLVEMKGVTKKYQDFCLDQIDLSIPKGCIMGLIGENGAGKTTCLKAMLDMISIDEGSISIFGKHMKGNVLEIKQRIGVVLSDCMFPENMYASEIQKVMRYMYPKWNSDVYMAYMKRFQLPMKKAIKQFSRGMKMKLNIAIALSHDADLLLLDEATSGLDPIVRDEILEILMDFIQDENHSVIISSHITSDIEKCCDYVTYIHKGRVRLSEEKDILLDQYGILKTNSEEFQKLDKDDWIAYQKTQFALHVLINDKARILRKLPEALIDKVTLEDMMLFMVKGDMS